MKAVKNTNAGNEELVKGVRTKTLSSTRTSDIFLIFSCICLCSTSSRKTAESVHPRLELVLIYFWMQLFMVPIARLAVNRSLGENAMKVLIKYRDFPFSPSLFVPLCLRKFGSTFDL